MKQIINRNYQSIVKRGKINKNTSHVDFMDKLREETREVKMEIIKPINLETLASELCDVMGVCMNWMKHYGLDPEKEFKKMIEKNENRH